MLIPESLHRSQRLAQERLSSSPGSLEEHCREVGERGFGYNLRHLIEVKPEECAPDAPIEVCLKQGEMMIFDPMMLHSESVVTTALPTVHVHAPNIASFPLLLPACQHALSLAVYAQVVLHETVLALYGCVLSSSVLCCSPLTVPS